MDVSINIMNIIRILKSELLLAFSTSSSEAVLPVMMKMENFGSPKKLLLLLYQLVIRLA